MEKVKKIFEFRWYTSSEPYSKILSCELVDQNTGEKHKSHTALLQIRELI